MNVLTACVKSLLLSVLLLPAVVLAEEPAAQMLRPDPLADAGKILVFLVLVVGMIAGLAWLVNKTRAGQLVGGTKQLRTLAVLPMGMKEKVAVIEVGNEQLVVGITPQQITLLTRLDEKIATQAEAPASFQDILKAAVRR